MWLKSRRPLKIIVSVSLITFTLKLDVRVMKYEDAIIEVNNNRLKG